VKELISIATERVYDSIIEERLLEIHRRVTEMLAFKWEDIGSILKAIREQEEAEDLSCRAAILNEEAQGMSIANVAALLLPIIQKRSDEERILLRA